jgi:hypothetical protein
LEAALLGANIAIKSSSGDHRSDGTAANCRDALKAARGAAAMRCAREV